VDITSGTIEQAEEIVAMVKAAAKPGCDVPPFRKDARSVDGKDLPIHGTGKVVAIGASTGEPRPSKNC